MISEADQKTAENVPKPHKVTGNDPPRKQIHFRTLSKVHSMRLIVHIAVNDNDWLV